VADQRAALGAGDREALRPASPRLARGRRGAPAAHAGRGQPERRGAPTVHRASVTAWRRWRWSACGLRTSRWLTDHGSGAHDADSAAL